MTSSPPLVLASASPRRAHILSMLGLEHEVRPANVPEVVQAGESPRKHVERLALAKARAVSAGRPDALVLAGDTVVVRDDDILGKPENASAAVEMLLTLAGRSHVVASGLALVGPGGVSAARVDSARVRFRAFDRAQAEAYASTGEPLDKAGAYGIQGLGASLVTHVDGDYFTVVGLSVAGLMTLLEECGWRYGFGRLHPLG